MGQQGGGNIQSSNQRYYNVVVGVHGVDVLEGGQEDLQAL